MARRTTPKAKILACQILLKKSGEQFHQSERRVLPARTQLAIELVTAPPAYVYIVGVNEVKDHIRLLLSVTDATVERRQPAGTAWLTLPERSYVVVVGCATAMDEAALAEYLGGRAPDRQHTGGRTTIT